MLLNTYKFSNEPLAKSDTVSLSQTIETSIETINKPMPLSEVATVILPSANLPADNTFAALFALWSIETAALFSEEEVAAMATYHGYVWKS